MRPILRAFAIAIALCSPAAAKAAWHEARSKHFIIYADSSAEDLRAYAMKIERFDQAVRTARNMSDPPLSDSGRLTVYMFPSVMDLGRFLGSNSIYGLYRTRATGSFAFVARNDTKARGAMNSDIIFFHEYAHHLMLQNSAAAYPAWLVEGFAEFLSTARIEEDGSVTLGAPANHRSAGVFALDRDLPLSQMVSGTYRWLNSWEQELLYARGWLLTHYLTFEPSRKGQLDRYVAAIQSGQSAGDSAKAAFGDLWALSRELDRYAGRKTISATVVRPDPAKTGQIEIRPLSPAEEAVIPVQMKSALGPGKAEASKIASQAQKIARKFPGDAAVQSALAEAEYDAGNFDAALAAADFALSIQPSLQHALIYKGRALMRMAEKSPAAADWAKIRLWFARANKLDPEDPEPLMLYYRTFLLAGAKPTSNAVKGLLYALVLAPQDSYLRLLAVRQLLTDGNLAEARKQFAPLAYDPHSREFRETADSVIAAIDAADAGKALNVIDGWRRKNGIN